MSRREEEVRRYAIQLLEELSITELPVRPDDVADAKGIDVKERSGFPEGVFGALYRKGNRIGIFLSSDCPTRGHRNFSLAHELGHYHIDGHLDGLFSSDAAVALSYGGNFRNQKDKYEREADWFAAELLAPTHLVRPRVLALEPSVEALSELARECRTSLSMMAIRYTELSDHPLAAVLSHDGFVEWTACSERIRDHNWSWQLSKRSQVAPRSATAAVARDRNAIRSGAHRSSGGYLCEWFEDAPDDVEIEEDVMGLGSFGRVLTLLVAPSLPDSDELREAEDTERDDPLNWRDALRGYEMD